MKNPKLIIAGVHKSATTSLHEHLSGDPRLFMSDPKEPHFLIRSEVQDRLHYGIWARKQYDALWDPARPGQVTGESSVLYSAFTSTFIEGLRGLDRMPHVVVMLRNPVDRAFSSYHDVRLKNADERAETFEAAVQRELDRGPWRLDGNGSPTLRHLALGQYAPGLRMLKETLGDRLLVMLMSDYTKSPTEGVATVQQHLGLPPRSIPAPSTPRNQGGRLWRDGLVTNLMRNPISVRVRRPLKTVAPKLHARFRDEISSRLTIAANPMDPDVRSLLMDLYRKDVEETAELIGRDLSTWTRLPQP